MMGSSSSSQLSALEQVLAVVSKPDMIKRNVEAILEKMQSLEMMKQDIALHQKTAEERIFQAAEAEKALAPKADVLATKEVDLKAWEDRLHNLNDTLDDKSKSIQAQKDDHAKAVANHTASVAAHKIKEDGFAGKLASAQGELDKRKKALDDHEARITQAAEANEAMKQMLATKLEKLKQLAG